MFQHDSDQFIVQLCIEGRDNAWNEFFRRFIPLMLNAIKSTLLGYGDKGEMLADDEGCLWDIIEIIYDRFRTEALLEECQNPVGIRPWLRAVAANQTRDWMRGRSTDKELPRRHAEDSMVSLDQPLYTDSSLTLFDTLLSDSDYEETLCDLLNDGEADRADDSTALKAVALIMHSILIQLAELHQSTDATDLRKYWFARISYVATYPLTDDEIADLANYTDRPFESLYDDISALRKAMDQEKLVQEAGLGRAEILRHKLLRAEARLEHHRNDPTPEGHRIRSDLEQQIDSMTKRRSELLRAGLKVPRPPAKQLLDILGLPHSLENQVSKILSRLRQEFLNVLRDQILKPKRSCL